MLGQSFELFDLLRVGLLTFLEITLSADNAVVLGLLVLKLPPEKRQKALTAGLISSLIFRAAALLSVSLLLRFAYIQAIGGLYLVYLLIRHIGSSKSLATQETSPSFWKTVLLIEGYDILFAIDSIIAGVALIGPFQQGAINPKLWVVYVGAVIGLIIIRFAAKLFSYLVEQRPRLEKAAYLMIGWIGLKMVIQSIERMWELPSWFFFEPIFWVVLVALFAYGLSKRKTA